jgi:hypothetical protein
MISNLEQYLKNATRGILGKRKLEIQEELERDILERTKKFELMGFSRDQGILKSLEELGSPRKLALGFWEVQMAMQKNLMLGSVMAVMLLSVVTWQATTQRDFRFSCASADQSYSLEGNKTATWLNVFLVARELEKVDFIDFTMEKFKVTTSTESKNYYSMRTEAGSGQFRTTNQTYVNLKNPIFTVQNPSATGSIKMQCKW